MAKRKPFSGDGITQMEHQSFRIDDATKEYWKAVVDEGAHDKLDAILGALGGSADTTPTIYNASIIAVDTEQSQALPANTKEFLIRSRNKGTMRIAFASGDTNTDYLTIPAGASYEVKQFFSNVTIYFQSNKPGDIIEIVAYT